MQPGATTCKRLLFLGSSCIYPKRCPQPMKEEYLLTGPLEPTNRPYAIAKIAGIEMCWSYNRQYGTSYLAAMPTNLYGPGDNFDLNNSHVLPALIRKMHEAKAGRAQRSGGLGHRHAAARIPVQRRHGRGLRFLMNLDDAHFISAAGRTADAAAADQHRHRPGRDHPRTGRDDQAWWDSRGEIVFDSTKPDGTMRKLMDVGRLHAMGWQATTQLADGLGLAYQDFESRSPAGLLVGV